MGEKTNLEKKNSKVPNKGLLVSGGGVFVADLFIFRRQALL
jgi:hypothetical protein